MRMSQRALSNLSSAMQFHAMRRVAVEEGNLERAAIYALWRDRSLALAGLPSMDDIYDAFETVNGLKPVNGAA